VPTIKVLEEPRKMLKSRQGKRLTAWAVHVFTASGAVAALLALAALISGDLRMSLLWLGVALIIDGIDGPLARRFAVWDHAPRFDGAVLDLVLDYLTYAVIPALLVYRFGMVPPGWEIPAAAYIMLTSLYCFGNREMKTEDNYFRGFPALWNLVVLAFYVVGSSVWTNLVAIAVLGVLTFIPLKYVHPFRVATLRPVSIAMTAIWAVTTFWLWLVADTTADPTAAAPVAYAFWLVSALYFIGLSLWRSLKGPRQAGR